MESECQHKCLYSYLLYTYLLWFSNGCGAKKLHFTKHNTTLLNEIKKSNAKDVKTELSQISLAIDM